MYEIITQAEFNNIKNNYGDELKVLAKIDSYYILLSNYFPIYNRGAFVSDVFLSYDSLSSPNFECSIEITFEDGKYFDLVKKYFYPFKDEIEFISETDDIYFFDIYKVKTNSISLAYKILNACLKRI